MFRAAAGWKRDHADCQHQPSQPKLPGHVRERRHLRQDAAAPQRVKKPARSPATSHACLCLIACHVRALF